MCSNNTACDDGGGGSNQNLKQQKAPKRGPGVAELEKILREQNKNEIQVFSRCLSPPLINPYRSRSRSLFSHPPLRPVMSTPSPPPPAVTFSPSNYRDRQIPEPFFTEANPNFPAQRKHSQYPSSLIEYHREKLLSSVRRLNHNCEPPSSQMLNQRASNFIEQGKQTNIGMTCVGTKRPYPFLVEDGLNHHSCQDKVPSFLLHGSSSCSNASKHVKKSMEEEDQGPGLGGSISIHNKFYSFFPTKEQMGREESIERREDGNDDLDLSLKL